MIQFEEGDMNYFCLRYSTAVSGPKKPLLKVINQLLCTALMKVLENYSAESDVVSYQVIMSNSEVEERQILK